MAFKWQPRDQAAETLEVDIDTLQAWIDSGHAPSRGQGDAVEVLIEFPDETDDPDGEDDEQAEPLAAEEVTAGDSAGPNRGEPFYGGGDAGQHPIQVVSKRELQMAGGMVAAWQRLAETTDHELTRSRRWGGVAWSIVAVLVLLGGVGIGWATHAVTDTRARHSLTEYELDRAAERSAGDRGRIGELETDLSQARAEMAEAQRSAEVSDARNEELLEQNRLIQREAERRMESDAALAVSLRETVEEQRERISNLREELEEAQGELAEARRQSVPPEEMEEREEGF